MCFLGTVPCCLRRSSVDPWGDLTARMHAITVIPDYFHLQHLAHAQQRWYDFQQLTTPLSPHDSMKYGTLVLCLRAAGQNESWMNFSDLSSNKHAFYVRTLYVITLRAPKVAAECLTLLLLIRSVGGSNLGLETGSTQILLDFPRTSRKIPEIKPPPLHSVFIDTHCSTLCRSTLNYMQCRSES